MLKQWMVCALISGAVAAGLAFAQAPAAPVPSPLKRTVLQKTEVQGSNFEVVTVMGEVIPNGTVGRHSHPGIETGYILEGEMTMMVDGKPPLPLKAGDSYTVPYGAIHEVHTGSKPAKFMAAYVVEKGKPLATPAP